MKLPSDFKLTERARGESIVLRPPKWAEYDAWSQLRRDNEAKLAPWEPEWDEKYLTRPSYRARLARFKRLMADGTGYPFHIFLGSSDHFIGACHVTGIRRHVAQSGQIGYWLGDPFTQKGYARAAVRAVTRFSFETLGLHRIEAAVQATNHRSVKLLEACGYTREGTAREYLRINGVWQDHEIYARLSSDIA